MMNPNIDIFYLINRDMANPLFDAIMPHFTNAGGFVSLLAICIIAFLIFKYFKKEKWADIAKLCLFALILSGIIAAALKLAFQSPRPFVELANVRQLVIPSEPNSFPSGHTSSTWSIITVLISELRNNKLIVIILILFAIIIPFSRVYSGVHYPIDVFTGMVIGLVSGVVVLKFKN